MKTIFLRILEEIHNKESALRNAIAAGDLVTGKQFFEVNPTSFASVPGSPFAYWVSDSLRKLFSSLPLFENNGRVARRGVNTNDDLRFLRLAWECKGSKWVPHVKGGVWSPYYADPHMLLNWGLSGKGEELLAERVTTRVYKTAIVPSRDLYFRPGLAWPRRTKSELSPRVMPAGCIFGDKGPAAIIEGDSSEELLALVAIMNSSAFHALVEFQLAAGDAKPGGAAHSYEVGVLQRTPVPILSESHKKALAPLARRAWHLRRLLDTRRETSHAFTLPGLLQVSGDSHLVRIQNWYDRVRKVEYELQVLQSDINTLCFEYYGISESDRQVILEGFDVSDNSHTESNTEDQESDSEDEEVEDDSNEESNLVSELLSWGVGVAFGRFDPRIATHVRQLPLEPEPFEPLPTRSPGMWPEDDAPIEHTDVLVDDEGHKDDIVVRIGSALEHAKFDVPDDLRSWLSKEFFPLHIKMYSKSRRKAPIYWQIATPSATYSVWLYIPAFNRDSMFRVQNDYVAAKLAQEERNLEALAREIRNQATNTQRKELAAKFTFVEELRAFLEEVKLVAPLWNPNLDDGVIINFSPLWRLVPQNKQWQKELKSTWNALCEGKYDWSHLAMHLWPERVIRKCANDRSMAIAHGIENVFWSEESDGKFAPQKTPTKSVDDLVRERTSAAVKSALKGLLNAPVQSGVKRSSKKGKHNA